MTSPVLVSGASSQLGVFLLPRLQSAGFDVTALSRGAPRTGLEVTDRVRWLHPDPVLDGTSGTRQGKLMAKHLVSCGPLDLACALIESQDNLRRVVAFSTSSVLTKADSGNQAESRQMTAIRDQESRLKALCGSRDIALALLRPTLIYGCGLDRNISLLEKFGRRFGFIPVSTDASGLRQPVHADDLAAVAVAALGAASAVTIESTACGGGSLAYSEMIGRIALACGEKVRVLPLSPRLLAAAVRLLSLLPPYRAVNAEMVRRQCMDMVFDDSTLRRELNYRPRVFEPARADFEIPEYAARLRLTA